MNRAKLVRKEAYLTSADAELVRNNIEQGRIEAAIDLIEQKTINIFNDLRNQISSHQAEYNEAKRKFNMGIIDQEEYGKVSNRINFSLLEIISDLEKIEEPEQK